MAEWFSQGALANVYGMLPEDVARLDTWIANGEVPEPRSRDAANRLGLAYAHAAEVWREKHKMAALSGPG